MKVGESLGLSTAPETTDERALVERLRRGEHAALNELATLHQARIARLVHRLAGWSNESDDIVQDVFINALSGIKRFRGDSKLSTWLSQIAINSCRQHHRKRLLRASFWRERWRAEPATAHDASARPEQQDTIEKVQACVRWLAPKYREVVVLHYLEGMETTDVAALLGEARSTIDVRLHRAREQMRDKLSDLVEGQ